MWAARSIYRQLCEGVCVCVSAFVCVHVRASVCASIYALNLSCVGVCDRHIQSSF